MFFYVLLKAKLKKCAQKLCVLSRVNISVFLTCYVAGRNSFFTITHVKVTGYLTLPTPQLPCFVHINPPQISLLSMACMSTYANHMTFIEEIPQSLLKISPPQSINLYHSIHISYLTANMTETVLYLIVKLRFQFIDGSM
jgi:hypothetical protein